MKNLETENILREIDFDKVAKAILTDESGNERKLLEFDFSDAKRLCWIAAEKWILRDLTEFQLEGLEKLVEMPVPRQKLPFKGYLDFCGTMRGKIEPFKRFAGQKFVVDWKTSKNTLGTDWRNRLLDSLQWMCYAEAYSAPVVLYRGIGRKGDTAEIIIEVPKTNSEEVIEYCAGIGDQVNALRAGNFEVFPRNKPHACGAFGRDCPYIEDCEKYTMPRLPLSEDKQLSYSFMNTFQLCNERARRDSLLDRDSEETLFGTVVHSGLAEIWRQAYQRYENTNN